MCGTLLIISANVLGKELCLGREREDICLPSSLHYCISCQWLFLTAFQILCVGRNVAVLFSSATGLLKPVFPYTSVSQLMLRWMWQSITINHIIYMSTLQCVSYHHMLLEAKAENDFVSFVSSLICFQFKYRDCVT